MGHATQPAAADAVFGLMAEFTTPQRLRQAVEQARQAGYQHMEAYTPFPIEGLAAALGMKTTRLPWVVLVGGILGALGGYGLQYYASVVSYPLNIGGRPLHSWPAFVPVTFELTILTAGLAAVLGMMALNGLPHPHHPVFNVPGFALASRDRFFLCIEAADPQFDPQQTRDFLEGLGAEQVAEVPS